MNSNTFTILEIVSTKKLRTVSTVILSSSAILCILPLGNESLILRSSLNVIVLIFINLMVNTLYFYYQRYKLKVKKRIKQTISLSFFKKNIASPKNKSFSSMQNYKYREKDS